MPVPLLVPVMEEELRSLAIVAPEAASLRQTHVRRQQLMAKRMAV
jgi:hypothetical protein